MVWHSEGGGDVEVDPPADDSGGHGPQGDVGDQRTGTTDCGPTAACDVNGHRDRDHVHDPVEVNEQRTNVHATDRRARYECRRGEPGHRVMSLRGSGACAAANTSTQRDATNRLVLSL